jgi:hypothetical protein
MSQEFYTKEIFSKHIEEIKTPKERYHQRFWLQEDSNPSHGNKSTDNPYQRLKRAADLQILIHPTQSPNLNPIEAC